MSFLSKLNPFNWGKKPSETPPPEEVQGVPAPPPEPPPMSKEELHAEIGRLSVLIPQCATDNLRAKYQAKVDILIKRAQA